MTEIVVRAHPAYPNVLAQMGDERPEPLHVRGSFDALGRTYIAIVGSRAATMYGEAVTRDLILGIAVQNPGVGIVSGGAFGIDQAAHRAALDAGLPTIAVLACGADLAYPAAHRELLDRIASTPSCAVVSEYPDGSAPTRERFLARNWLIAGFSIGMVVVEAARRSGSMAAARAARTLGVPLMAVPGPITSAASGGSNQLIREGARLVTSGGEVLERLTRAAFADE